MNSKLIEFYRGNGKDIAGRTIADVWAFNFDDLEAVHDYIQWLFPSAKPSQFNANAPLLDDETVALFRGDDALRANLSRSLSLMADFYGLKLVTGDTVTVVKADNYSARKSIWQDAPPGFLNHNMLRLTRILEALNVLGRADLSAALCACLAQIQQEEPKKIPAKTLHFWKLAAGVQ